MLLSNLDLLATAPGGVAHLRELILTLAVQGKLVPQDPADEPASVLLQKIRADKDRLIAAGKIKQDKPLAEVTDEENPFQLPKEWKWVRLAELAYPQAGFSFKSEGFNDARVGLPLIRIRDVGANDPSTFFSGEFREEFIVSRGDWLISMDGEFRVREWRGPKALLNQRVARLIFFGNQLLQPFISTALQLQLHELQGTKAYTTVDHLSGGQIAAAFIPLPPLIEQSRIVTRVEELMRLCDALEAKGQLEAMQHAQLVSTLLGTLTASTTPEELADNWQRVAQHFDLLLDRPEAIDALEQTLLQLAVRGLLVPQDPTDEPASVLLARIRSEKDRLIAEGKIKRDKPLPSINDEEKPFELPMGWEWVKLPDLCSIAGGATPSKANPKLWAGDIPWVSPKDMKVAQIRDAQDHISISAIQGSLSLVPSGSLLMVVRGMILAHSFPVAETLVPVTINQDMKAATPHSADVLPFLLLLTVGMKSEILARVERSTHGTCKLESPKLFGMNFPLPPLAEQSRIVTRVTALRRLCADLRQRLKTAQVTQSHLAKALVESSNCL